MKILLEFKIFFTVMVRTRILKHNKQLKMHTIDLKKQKKHG